MREDRLVRLAHLLDTIDPQKFCLRDWSCGTTACAVGHAMCDPWFKGEGLHAEIGLYGKPSPRYEDYEGWDAVEQFFELGSGEAEHLFYEEEYEERATPKDVAERIWAFIKQKKEERKEERDDTETE